MQLDYSFNNFPVDTPEQLGISSKKITKYVKKLDENGIPVHSIMIVRHGKIAAEVYWHPFNASRRHRLYSSTKSIVSVAIGMLCDDGLITLDDHIVDYFPEKLPPFGVHEFIKKMTIRDMLKMATAHDKTAYDKKLDIDWIKPFFSVKPTHLPGTVFSYDTSSSTTLCALVEKLSGKRIMDYIREKFIGACGFSDGMDCVKTPGGESWGGSGGLLTTRDFAKIALMCLNKGVMNGVRILSEEYIKAATSYQINNTPFGHGDGYGYQFWMWKDKGFAFQGMGGQCAYCIPEKDLIFVMTADTQLADTARAFMVNAFFDEIFPCISDSPLEQDAEAYDELTSTTESLQLIHAAGEKYSPLAKQISGVDYTVFENPMGISEISFAFSGDEGCMSYTNANRHHSLKFGMGKNVFQKFPVNEYECAVSAEWLDDDRLRILCYIIDDYLATLEISAKFTDGAVTLIMRKAAEAFLEEYEGFASGIVKSNS